METDDSNPSPNSTFPVRLGACPNRPILLGCLGTAFSAWREVCSLDFLTLYPLSGSTEGFDPPVCRSKEVLPLLAREKSLVAQFCLFREPAHGKRGNMFFLTSRPTGPRLPDHGLNSSSDRPVAIWPKAKRFVPDTAGKHRGGWRRLGW